MKCRCRRRSSSSSWFRFTFTSILSEITSWRPIGIKWKREGEKTTKRVIFHSTTVYAQWIGLVRCVNSIYCRPLWTHSLNRDKSLLKRHSIPSEQPYQVHKCTCIHTLFLSLSISPPLPLSRLLLTLSSANSIIIHAHVHATHTQQ